LIGRSKENVTLLGAGEVSPTVLERALALAPILVAADGAAGQALALGRMPQAVIGDLDSIDAPTRARIPPPRLHALTEQDSTDFDKCLRNIAAPLVLGVGFAGLRLDHELAALNALVRLRRKRCILIGPVDICFHAPPRLALDLPPGSRLSLFPLAPVSGRSTGLRWPIDGLALAPDGRIGTSNQATGPVTLAFDGPGMLVILPQAALTVAMAALRPSRPAPGDT
jgi:thiamine pyrophosphokinase